MPVSEGQNRRPWGGLAHLVRERPQGLKPRSLGALCGATEFVP